MGDKRKAGGEKGLSAGVLAVVFLLWVGVCALFFSLGFLVGYNEQSSKAELGSERGIRSQAIPPAVNSPTQSLRPRANERTSSTSDASPVPVADLAESQSSGAPLKASRRSTADDRNDLPEDRTTTSAFSPPSKEVRMGFTVQVDALRAKQDAEALVRILKGRQYPVFLVTPEYSSSKDNLYRVQVGPFTSREDAENVRAKLAQEGFKPFIKR
jgi:cell division septation protein DedD